MRWIFFTLLGSWVVKWLSHLHAALEARVQSQSREPKIFKLAFISKISANLSCDIKPEGALYSVFYAEESKRPYTWELRVPCVDLQPYHLIITSASGSCSYKLIKLQSQ